MANCDGHPRGPFRRRNWPVHHNNCLNPWGSFLQAHALVHRLEKVEATLLKSTMGGVPGHDIALSIPVSLAPDAGLLDADRRAVSGPGADQQADGPVPARRRLQPDCRHVAATPSRRLAAMDVRAEKLAGHTGIVASSVAVRFNGLHDAAPSPQQATRQTQAPHPRRYLARRHLDARIARNSHKKAGPKPCFWI